MQAEGLLPELRAWLEGELSQAAGAGSGDATSAGQAGGDGASRK